MVWSELLFTNKSHARLLFLETPHSSGIWKPLTQKLLGRQYTSLEPDHASFAGTKSRSDSNLLVQIRTTTTSHLISHLERKKWSPPWRIISLISPPRKAYWQKSLKRLSSFPALGDKHIWRGSMCVVWNETGLALTQLVQACSVFIVKVNFQKHTVFSFKNKPKPFM